MTFSGDLAAINLADVFQNIQANRTSGVLEVTSHGQATFVLFERGQVAGFSVGVGKGMPLAQHLVQRGWVQPAQLDAAQKRRARSRKLLSAVLVETGALGQPELQAAVAEIMSEGVYDLMLCKEATFRFTPDELPARVFDAEQKAAGVRLEIGPLLMESARRRDEWERIHKVVTSDDDLFLLLEGWEQLELDEAGQAVAPMLDGRTPVRDIVAALTCSRFQTMKAISDLVLQGAARPATATELEAMVEEALGQGDHAAAIAMMTRIVGLERNNQTMRGRLADLLEREGRPEDAAAEYAQMGFEAVRGGDTSRALELYATAARLNPRDLVLHDRRLQLLAEHGTAAQHSAALAELTALLLEMGLAERARHALRGGLERRELRGDVTVVAKLAEVEGMLAHSEEAFDLWLRAADLSHGDEQAQTAHLRRAQELRPDDQALAKRIEDIETGRGRRRQRARRRRMVLAAAGLTVLAAGTAGVAELVATHRIVAAFGEFGAGRSAEAARELSAVRGSYRWLPAGYAADALLGQLVDVQLRSVETQLASHQHHEVLATLSALHEALEREDLRQRLEAILERVRTEQQAIDVVELAARGTEPNEQALSAIEALRDPRLLDYLLAQLEAPRVDQLHPSLQCAILRALMRMDSPRTMVAAAKLFVRSRDSRVQNVLRTTLDRAAHHRRAGREGEWQAVYAWLENAAGESTTAPAAREALKLLRGD